MPVQTSIPSTQIQTQMQVMWVFCCKADEDSYNKQYFFMYVDKIFVNTWRKTRNSDCEDNILLMYLVWR
jgi:hypothetical protein